MTAFDYIQLHPWWTLIYLCVAGGLMVAFAEAIRGRR